jgi:RHS repeat-associated protein
MAPRCPVAAGGRLGRAGPTQVLENGTRQYLYGDGRIAQGDGVNIGYFLGDTLVSVRQLTNDEGAVTLTQSYEPYGEVLSSEGTGASIYGFDAEQTDSYIKLINLRSRLYDPYLNQFIQPDTIVPDPRIPTDWNKYVFVRDNPVNYTDPSGHKAYRYDRKAAASYAKTWETSNNTAVYGQPFHNDCTSFVSQALKAGGMPEDETWFFSKKGTWIPDPFALGGAWTCSKYPWSPKCGVAWAVTQQLHDFLITSRSFSYTDIKGESFDGRIPKSPDLIPSTMLTNVQEGDVVFYSQLTAGVWNHAAFVVGKGPLTEVGKNITHSDLPYQEPLIADHSSHYSALGPRSINDITDPAFEIVIVHIPDVIYLPDVWEIPWRCE